MFFDSEKNEEVFMAELAGLAVNPELLAIYMGIDDRWKPLNDTSLKPTATRVVDDLAIIRRKDAVSAKRRESS